MTRGWTLLIALVVAGCTSGQGVNPMAKAVVSTLGSYAGIGGEEPAADAEPPKILTRAKIEESGLAMIQARVGDDTRPQVLTGLTDNGGFITFATPMRQSLTFRGGLITATRGIETDLLSTQVFPGDPVAWPTKPANWPTSIRRIYHLPNGTRPEGRIVDVTCTFLPGDPGEIGIVERTYSVIQMLESCQGDGYGFENAHLVDVHNGTIWRSRQWIGFDSAPAFFDVLEPYTP
jgi:hypothetical protein